MWVESIDRAAVRALHDSDGFPTLTFEQAVPEMLPAVFEDDLASTMGACDALEMLDDVVSGRESGAQLSGNAHTITMLPEQVSIQNDILPNEEPLEMSPEQFRVILDVWADYLEGRDRPASDGRRP